MDGAKAKGGWKGLWLARARSVNGCLNWGVSKISPSLVICVGFNSYVLNVKRAAFLKAYETMGIVWFI